MHLIMDFKCTNQRLMRDQDALQTWFYLAVEVIGMTIFGKPIIEDYPFPERDGTALSAVCFIGESGLYIHTYPEFNHVFLDIFSCTDFDIDKALTFVTNTFQIIGQPQIITLQRGIDMETGEPLILHLL